ncbi:hypothetical protein L5I01_32460 [Gordonia sp. HY442]|uniref:DUF7134 domain-containing protein n=1 Tax=Gordonia zhenghanii TaxID=2911516 RepID=UPI001F3AEF9C|nr:hypothetical protein [Gordonia zhenghanii]MCF8608078.1 hypothetical protein [Gordonia zhenghanii]
MVGASRESSRAGRAATLVDLAIAIGCFALFTGPLLVGVVDRHGSLAAQAAFGLLAAAPLVFRRRRPIEVLACVTVVLVAAMLVGVQFTPFVSDAGLVFPIAVYTVSVQHGRAWSLSVSAVAAVVTAVGGAIALAVSPDIDQDAVQLVLAVPAWLIGDATRGRREFQRQVREQERRWEGERQQRCRVEEHLRLSREVHDIVSHGLSMIAVRSWLIRWIRVLLPARMSVRHLVPKRTHHRLIRHSLVSMRRLLTCRQMRTPWLSPQRTDWILRTNPPLLRRHSLVWRRCLRVLIRWWLLRRMRSTVRLRLPAC